MKRIPLLSLALFVCVGLFISGCGGKEDKKNPVDPNGLPAGWRASWETNLEATNPHLFWYTWHRGTPIVFYTVVYDNNNQVVADYDTSETTWSIEPAGFATITDTTGPLTQITPTSTGTFILHWSFKGTWSEPDFEVVP
jgi:hypothetical protein